MIIIIFINITHIVIIIITIQITYHIIIFNT